MKSISILVSLLIGLSLCYADYKEVAVENGGKLAGTVTLKGSAEVEGFKITKDNSCCGTEKPSHRLAVKEGKVQNALIIIEGIKEGKKWVKQSRKIDQKDCEYIPFIQYMENNKKIKIYNNDPVLHNVHGYLNGKTVFNIAMPLPGQKVKNKLKEAGMYEIFCDAGHSWMSSYVYASEHPYCAISDENGKFEIGDIPPGEYTVKLWHAGWKVAEASKDDNGIVTSYKFEAPHTLEKKITIEAGKGATLDFELEAK